MPNGSFGKCCTDCQIYWTCETKWYRGENKEENLCCPTCNYYTECRANARPKKKNK